jgi:hypothetical protein|nr:MAG TPA: hypothetical protein [Caudoviricetes sp.]
MSEQTRLEDQEKRLQYETELKLLSDSLLSLSAKSVRGLITIDEIILHSFERYLVALSQFVKAYPDGLEKSRMVQNLINLHQSFSFSGYEKHISNQKQLENHYLQKYNEFNSVLSALCSLALDNPDDDAYKIISDYKNS